MIDKYEEIIDGERYIRLAPGDIHEAICTGLYKHIIDCMPSSSPVKILPIRSPITFSNNSVIRPDIALITLIGAKVWLAIEIIDSSDHKTDTVIKKNFYEEIKLPRLWVVDPRFENVEIYCQTPYGMTLNHIYAGKELLTDISLPGFALQTYKIFEGK